MTLDENTIDIGEEVLAFLAYFIEVGLPYDWEINDKEIRFVEARAEGSIKAMPKIKQLGRPAVIKQRELQWLTS